jgi:integrase
MPLNDAQIRTAKAQAKPYRLSDGKGMYLEVTPSGGKYWRMAYRFDGKRKLLALGVYPDVPLAGRKDEALGDPDRGYWLDGARDKRDAARKQLAAGIDPGERKQADKRARKIRAADSFEVIAREWLGKYKPTWSEANAKRIDRLFARDVFPRIGSKPIAELTAPDVLAMARRIEHRGALETAHRAIGNCGQVFRYAVATGRALRDPTRDLRGALPPVKSTHFAAITEPKRAGELLRLIDGYSGTHIVRCALKLAPLLFVRPGELRRARWADFDLDAGEWRYRVTKTDVDHIVPLPTQAVAILRDLYAFTGPKEASAAGVPIRRGEFLFPSARGRGKTMSENTICAALRNLDIPKEEMSAHGFRAMARTLQDEILGFRVDLIEHQLAHAVKDPNGRAYNRTAHLPERRKNMQAWADYLDRLRSGADVVELGKRRRSKAKANDVTN